MLRAWVEGVMARSKSGLGASLYRGAMTLPSFCYQAAIRSRHTLYDYHLLPVHTFAVPIISVGNLICGGAGKTQVVMLLLEKLQGHRLAVISRGYQGQLTRPVVVDPDKMSAEQCGDEAWMLAKRFPDVMVIVGRDRVKAAALAEEQGAELILLDDGMQHRRLGRDIEIVVLEGSDPLAAGEFLPKGRLREVPERLSKANLLISVGPLQGSLRELPHVEVRIVPETLFQLTLPSQVGLFCGLGMPSRFVKTIESMGCKVVATHFLADHAQISQVELDQFAQSAKQQGAEALICTEKDWVKGPYISTLPIGWLRTKIEVTAGEALLESILRWERG